MVLSPRAIPERDLLNHFILILKSLWEVQLLIVIFILKLEVAALKNKARAVEDLEEEKQGPDLLKEVGVEVEDPFVAWAATHAHCHHPHQLDLPELHVPELCAAAVQPRCDTGVTNRDQTITGSAFQAVTADGRFYISIYITR